MISFVLVTDTVHSKEGSPCTRGQVCHFYGYVYLLLTAPITKRFMYDYGYVAQRWILDTVKLKTITLLFDLCFCN